MKKYYIRELFNTDDGIVYPSKVCEALAIVTTFIDNTAVIVENRSTEQTYILTCRKVENEF